MGVGVDDEAQRRALAGPTCEGHGLRCGGRLIEQARTGHRKRGQVRDDSLEGQQCLEATLTDLGLVRRVGGIPSGVLQHAASDDRRRVGVVVAESDHRSQHGVSSGQGAQISRDDSLRLGGRQRQTFGPANGLGHRGFAELLERVETDHGEHEIDFVLVRPDVTIRERHVVIEGRHHGAGIEDLGHGALSRRGISHTRSRVDDPPLFLRDAAHLRASPRRTVACTVGGDRSPAFQRRLPVRS